MNGIVGYPWPRVIFFPRHSDGNALRIYDRKKVKFSDRPLMNIFIGWYILAPRSPAGCIKTMYVECETY